MDKTKDIVTDRQIELAWGNANFGANHNKRHIIANAMLKYVCGFDTGHTIRCICEDIGLMTPHGEVSYRGKAYLWAAYSGNLDV